MIPGPRVKANSSWKGRPLGVSCRMSLNFFDLNHEGRRCLLSRLRIQVQVQGTDTKVSRSDTELLTPPRCFPVLSILFCSVKQQQNVLVVTHRWIS